MKPAFRALTAALLLAIFIMALAALAGCDASESKPKVMVFLGKSSKSYAEMKPVVDKLEKKYKGKVTWVNVDYDDPANKGELEKYKVSMNPTVIIFNKEGKIKETFMGAAREDMLAGSIESYIPSDSKQQSSQPGTSTVPLNTAPQPAVPLVPTAPTQ
jgi:thioredoxin-like negative regulator of GroEL